MASLEETIMGDTRSSRFGAHDAPCHRNSSAAIGNAVQLDRTVARARGHNNHRSLCCDRLGNERKSVDLVNLLEQEKAAGKAGKLAFALMRMDLVILDELGYLPFSQAGRALLFHLLSKLYEHTSVMITTNL